MGRDKALIEVDGVPLWLRQLRVLEALRPAEIFLAGPAREEWQDVGCTIIADAADDAGPLGGIVSALRHTPSGLLLTLAVDLPNITSDYLYGLLELCGSDCGIVPRTEQYEPLVAIYPAGALDVAQQLLTAGSYSLQRFAAACVGLGMATEHRVSTNDLPVFLNMNTPADLAAFSE